MAQTDESKKKVYVHAYTDKNGKKIAAHYRSTPSTSDGAKKKTKK